jgi:hypothetical protein
MVDIYRTKGEDILSDNGFVNGKKFIDDNEIKSLYQNYKGLSKRYSNPDILEEQAFFLLVKNLDQLDFISINNGVTYQIDG